MSLWQERIYPHMPILAQNGACSLQGCRHRGLRYGGAFSELLEWLEETQWWSVDRIVAYQEEQLEKLLLHAYATVPYYRRMFDSLRLTPKEIKSSADLPKLPVLTKEHVAAHHAELISTAFSPKKLVFSHTSGTAGKSLQFYQEPRAVQFRWAVWWRHKRRFGVNFDAPYATFTGLTAVPLNQQTPPFWRENRAMHQTIFTMHHVVPTKVRAIVDRLNHGGFVYYSGYPSILSLLASLIREQGLEITAAPAVVFTGAENLYEDQRQLMSEVYRCLVTDQYGFSEGCGNASRCPQDLFHEDHEFGILECGNPETADDGGQRGRIIATGFASYAMPFIRYDVGDVGNWRPDACTCGRHTKVLSRIEGRVEDYVITPEGRRIMRFDYIFKDTNNIREAQVVQTQAESIQLRIVRRAGFSMRDETLLRDEIKRRVSPRLKVSFEYVDEIERESSGKFRAVRSLIGHQG
jgi:phenylacetate-CoA ligase